MDPRLNFNFSIKDHTFMKDIYEALDEDDTSVVVMIALKTLRSINGIPLVPHTPKCEKTSEALRKDGNNSLMSGSYQEALELYNTALLFAPNNSRTLKLAYGNRSYLLFEKSKFEACLKDTTMALAIPTAIDIDVKLNSRLKDAMQLKDVEKNIINQGLVSTVFGENGFKIEESNPEIPCASPDVGVVRERQGPTLVAKNHIKVGTVLAIEEAFSVSLPRINYLNSCYYCTKKSLNLIPCEGCCSVLFCDAKCQQYSFQEGHNIECQIIEVIEALASTSMPPLPVKIVLKIRQKCKNWEEFIEASYSLGLDRSKKSSIKEIYDVNEKFSSLCFNDDRLFIHGAIKNTCFAIATTLHYLETVKNYLPEDEIEKEEAMKALARMMMFAIVNIVPVSLYQPVTVENPMVTTILSQVMNYGCFSFLGKLRHACVPNLVATNLNRKMVVIASQPIDAGTPLTVHYLGYHGTINSMNSPILYSTYGLVCNCVLCTGKNKFRNKQKLNVETTRKLEELNFSDIVERLPTKAVVNTVYPVLCEIMTVLKDFPYSDEYGIAKSHFAKCHISFADYECGNIHLDCINRNLF